MRLKDWSSIWANVNKLLPFGRLDWAKRPVFFRKSISTKGLKEMENPAPPFDTALMGCPYQAWFPQSNPTPPLLSLISQALKGFHQRELACLLSILPKQKKSHLLRFSYDLGLIPWPESKGKGTWGLGAGLYHQKNTLIVNRQGL